MNAAELIASGLLEAYVLGEGSAEERALVEHMAATDAGVKAELDAIEAALEQLAFANAKEPPAHVRAHVMGATGAEAGKVLPIKTARPVSSTPWWAVAAVVALLLSVAGNFMLYDRMQRIGDRLADLENERTVLAQQMQVQQASMKRAQDQLALLFDPATHVVQLAGQAIEPQAAARVYVDAASNDVYLGVGYLPKPPAGKQYQLWAQVDGKMVDAGLLDLVAATDQLQRMKRMPNATAFGVTLEPAGGSAEPTLSALYLFGQAS